MTPKFIYHEFRIVMRARDYIRELAASGRHFFTTEDAVDAIGGKPDAVRAQLRRLGEQGHLAQPVRSFRVIVPPEYLRLGCLPAEQFIDPLMEFLGEPYYVGLLSAAERHGAAHHRPQITQVVVRKNRAPVSCGVVRVVFIARADLGQMPVSRLNTPRGAVSYSTPEVTGLELVGYPGHAGGLVWEGTGCSVGLPYLNMAYQGRIPHTKPNAMALGTAILRGAARNFSKVWGVSFYNASRWPDVVTDMEYAYRKGATHVWLWGGWPNVDADYPHQYKLALFEQLRDIARRHGPRDMRKLLHAAKAAVVLPPGYTMGINGMLLDTSWLHADRKNKHGLKIRDVLHNAYVEVERLLREGVEFDIAADLQFKKTGYDELIYILADGKVRVERGGDVQILDGPRVPKRTDFGPGPKVSATIVRRPLRVDDPLALDVVVELGSGEVARPRGKDRLGQKPSWSIGQCVLYRPDGFARPRGVALRGANAAKTVLRGGYTYEKEITAPGKYRVCISTIDEFSRWAETWLEFTVKARYVETPVAQFAEKWKFRLDKGQVGVKEGWFGADLDDAAWAEIPVPAWWENVGYGGYNGIAWYRTKFNVPAGAKGKTIILAFKAVDGDAIVYLNGRRLGRHDGDNALHWDKPFEFDVSQQLRYGQANQMTVSVKDTERLGGIFKPVRLVARRPAE